MIPEKVAEELRSEAAHLKSDNISLKAERDGARKALDALRQDLASRPAPVKKAAARAAA